VPSAVPTPRGTPPRDIALPSPTSKHLLIFLGSGFPTFARNCPHPEKPGDIKQWKLEHCAVPPWGRRALAAPNVRRGPTPRGQSSAEVLRLRHFANPRSGWPVEPSTATLWTRPTIATVLARRLGGRTLTAGRKAATWLAPGIILGNHESPPPSRSCRPTSGLAIVPMCLLQAHSAALRPRILYGPFRPGAWFLRDYHCGSLPFALARFVNRNSRTGYKVVRVKLPARKATVNYEAFSRLPFVADTQIVWGRPVGVGGRAVTAAPSSYRGRQPARSGSSSPHAKKKKKKKKKKIDGSHRPLPRG